MNKREFIKSAGLASMACMMGGLTSLSCRQETPKKSNVLPSKWIWLRPDISKNVEHWDSVFGQLAECGIQAVLPQIYASRETLFDHPTLPVKDQWLERIIPIAHQHGLEVHAWMWSMPLNNEKFFSEHPDWFSVNRLGERSHEHPAYVDYYKFLDPCHPEVKEFVQSNVMALANIDALDGIHLDYIRQPDVILAEGLQPKYNIVQDKEYPQYDYPYSSYCIDEFKNLHGYDPIELGDDAPFDDKWRQFRYDKITSLVNEYLVPAAKEKNKTITAAVFPNWESVRQQWQRWDLDGFLPMLYHGFYNEDINWIGAQIKKNIALVNDPKKKIFSGLFLPHLKNEGELEDAINVSLENGAGGYSLFAHENLTPEDFQILKSLNQRI